MKAKLFLTALLVAVFSMMLAVNDAQASLEPVMTVGEMIAMLNAGDLDSSLACFSADGIVTETLANRSYTSADGIERFLNRLYHDGREYDIVKLTMVDDRVDMTVEIADQGHVWARQTMTAEVVGNKIKNLEVVETRLTLWRISR